MRNTGECICQGVTKRCRLSWLANSAIVYEPKCGGKGGGLRGLSQWVQLCTIHCTWSPNKLWRYNSIFNIWYQPPQLERTLHICTWWQIKWKRVDVHATPTTTWADFTPMMERTSWSGHCHPVYSVAVYTVKKTGKFQIRNKSGATKVTYEDRLPQLH